jgi:hypothetical protein
VHEPAVGAGGEDLDAEALELGILDRDRGQLRRSNEGEIAWVETEDDPLSLVVGELQGLEAPRADERVGLEVRGLLADLGSHHGFLPRRRG